jgi:hypothetical protein
MTGKAMSRRPQSREGKIVVLVMVIPKMSCLYLNLMICENAESQACNYIYNPESGDGSLQAKSM